MPQTDLSLRRRRRGDELVAKKDYSGIDFDFGAKHGHGDKGRFWGGIGRGGVFGGLWLSCRFRAKPRFGNTTFGAECAISARSYSYQ